MKVLCLYHSVDLDGWMSAAIVKHYYLSKASLQGVNSHITDNSIFIGKSQQIDFVGYNYGDKVPDVSSYDTIIMCDMSLLKRVMEQLHEDHTKEIVWLDHHKSAIEDSEIPLKYNDLKGIRDVKFAACELTWMYFFPNTHMPNIVKFLGRYDCFGHKGTADERFILEFQYGARQAINNYNTAYDYLIYNITDDIGLHLVDTHIIDTIVKSGKYIYEYLCREAKAIYNNKIDITLIDYITDCKNIKEYKFALINKERFNPVNFEINYHNDEYDGVACFWLSKSGWQFSLYNDNDKVDCSAIAKNMGGGGHKGAAGFIIPEDQIGNFLSSRKIQK